MAVYNKAGQRIDGGSEYQIFISNVKAQNPTFNDDQILDKAIQLAKAAGSTAVIVYDGEDVHFSGSVTHVCKGFGGIDFNDSTIYMPNYDDGTIIQIEPDETSDVTVAASAIFDTYTTSETLKGKVFRMNGNINGNSEMCLGTRLPAASYNNVVLYASPTVKTTPDGFYTTGKLFLTPNSGDVVCYNVHDFPGVTFEVCNAKVVSYASSNMSLFIYCIRSNTHIHDFDCSGRSTVNVFHSGIIKVDACSDVEIDHIYGVNPVQQSLTSGYIFSLNQVSFAYCHDISMGDRVGWGAIGCGNITNCVFERCYMDRWDNHYAQFGYNVVRDCTFNHVEFGIGNGTLLFENCTILLNKDATSTVLWFMELRTDVVGVFDGDIIIRNCEFLPGKQSAANTGIFSESPKYAKPSNSAVDVAPAKRRIIENCRLPDGVKYVFQTGTSTSADQPMFVNLVYAIENTLVPSSATKLLAVGSGETVTPIQSENYYGKIS